MRRRLHTILYLAAVLTFPMLCTGCGEEASQQTKDCYRTLRVERQDYTLYRRFAVKLESRKNILLRPQVSGRLTKIYVKEGARVKKGEPLFVIDQAPYLAAVDAAKAQVSTARAALSTAQLNLEGKQKLYEQQMGMIPYRVGDLVDPGSGPYLTLASESNYIYAYGALSEEALSELLRDFGCSSLDELPTKLPAVTLYSNWGEKTPVEGHIDAISGTVESDNGATYIRASFFNTTEIFRSGSNGYIEMPYVMHGVIVVPQEAVVDIHDKYLVYKVMDGKAVETEVNVLHYDDGQNFVVTAGLAPGDVIIAEGAGFVTDGIEVTEKKEKKGGEQS